MYKKEFFIHLWNPPKNSTVFSHLFPHVLIVKKRLIETPKDIFKKVFPYSTDTNYNNIIIYIYLYMLET